MTTNQQDKRPHGGARLGPNRIIWVAVIAGALVTAACQKDARLADAKLRVPEVKDITYAGLELNADATPQMVTYALLRAIKADYDAGDDLDAREQAFDVQLDLCAPATIFVQQQRALGAEHTKLQDSVYRRVRAWAPTVGHYAGSFNTTFEDASKGMRVKTVAKGAKENACGAEERHVLLNAPDPDGDPNAGAVIRVRLVQEEGRWRVWWVGFQTGMRRLPGRT